MFFIMCVHDHCQTIHVMCEEFQEGRCWKNNSCIVSERSQACILCMQREKQAENRNNEYCCTYISLPRQPVFCFYISEWKGSCCPACSQIILNYDILMYQFHFNNDPVNKAQVIPERTSPKVISHVRKELSIRCVWSYSFLSDPMECTFCL